MASNEMAFFPANFILQTPHHHDNHQPPHCLTTILPQDFHGVASFLGKRSMSFPGIELGEEAANGEDDLSDDESQAGEKKRRLNMEQVKTLEKNFELGNKLEPERKMQLARALGLQPRQIAIWFQNRRARWKTKQLEKDYDVLKRQFEAIKADNEALQAHNKKLQAEILALKSNREPIEAINLNKETEGSSSNRSDHSSEIKLDIISRTPATNENDDDEPATTAAAASASAPHRPIITSRAFFPTNMRTSTTTTTTTTTGLAQLFQTSPRPTTDQLQCQKMEQMVKQQDESSFSNMFCNMDDQSAGLWPWLEHQQFN